MDLKKDFTCNSEYSNIVVKEPSTDEITQHCRCSAEAGCIECPRGEAPNGKGECT